MQYRPAALVQPDGQTAAWGVILLAVLPVREGPDDPHAGERIGPRMPALEGWASASDSGIWLAAADRDTAAAAPGDSREGAHKVVMGGKEYAAPRVAKNCATCLDTSKRKSGECSSALRFSAANESEARWLPFRRPPPARVVVLGGLSAACLSWKLECVRDRAAPLAVS